MEASIQQLALVSSVLGGFSFTFLSALLVFGTEKKIKFWLVLGFALASMCFLLSAVGWSLLGLHKPTEGMESHHQSLVKLLILGLVTIIASLGLSGWLNGRKTGIATCAISIPALLYPVFGILDRYITM